MNLQHDILIKHKQLTQFSCIPMAVELVLKLLGRMRPDIFRLQQQWQDRWDGSFSYFDNRVENGVRFRRQFTMPRGQSFPLQDIFDTISSELQQGRYVIASLRSGPTMFHMHVVYDSTPVGEFKAVTYRYPDDGPLETENVREVIKGMDGTDILTYEVWSPGTQKPKVGRNDPCPCDSGKKYKNCCGKG